MVPASRHAILCASILTLGLGGILTGCSGNQALENRFTANPALQTSPSVTDTNPSPTAIASPNPQTSPTASPDIPSDPNAPFNDLTDLPPAVVTNIQDLATLGIITAQSPGKFAPLDPITRAEFSRWLFQANNVFFANQPSKQIRAATPNAKPIFTDVPNGHPDFAAIQGLAEAGLIPSPLTNDPSATLFRPNASLTREDLLLWKVPLDQRGTLPKASLENIKETWGFQDAAKINPKVWPALYGDFQNGDQANIRRIFGFIILFQPQKPVTRAEAAAALGYLGNQTDGVTAQDALRNKENPPLPSPSPTPTAPQGQEPLPSQP